MVLATAGERRVDHDRSAHGGINVGDPERLVSAVAGGALALYGLKRRGWSGLSLAALGAELIRRGASGHCRVYGALGMSTATGGTRIEPRAPGEIVSDAATVDARKAIKIERSITIARPRAELFAIWRNFDRLPEFIPDLESVTTLGGGRSHWVARVPGGKRVEWDSEVINELPGELIAWKTVGEPDVAHAGSVHFTDSPGGRGTEMRIVLDYEPPGGKLGALLAAFTRLFGQAPDSKIQEDLRRFKMTVEAGDVSTIESQTFGR
jgi:uncharacterized membrane protein